jgi:IS30 family transposase
MLGSIPATRGGRGVSAELAEVHRLNRQGVPNRAIAGRLGMSHTTVHRLLGLREPPRYERRGTSSFVDPFTSQIRYTIWPERCSRWSSRVEENAIRIPSGHQEGKPSSPG